MYVNAHLPKNSRPTELADFLPFKPKSESRTIGKSDVERHPDAVPGLDAEALMKDTLKSGMAVKN